MIPPARVLIVDDHPLMRGGLVQLIAKERDLTLCGEADSVGTTILAVDDDPPPDLVILDLMLGQEDGLELIKQIRALRHGILILVISMHDEWIYAERALRAGASGYIMKKRALGGSARRRARGAPGRSIPEWTDARAVG